MPSKVWSTRKSFTTDRTLKRFLSRMNSSMFCQVQTLSKTLPTFTALVFTAVNNHMLPQADITIITLLTLRTRVWFRFNVHSHVERQLSFCSKPFVTHCTLVWLWLVIMWRLRHIISSSSFHLYRNRTFICTTCIALTPAQKQRKISGVASWENIYVWYTHCIQQYKYQLSFKQWLVKTIKGLNCHSATSCWCSSAL